MLTQQQLMQAVQAAAAALEQGQLASAKAQSETVLAAAPGEPNASQIMALVLMREDNAQAAVTHLRNANQSMPDHPPVLNMLGVALGPTGNRAAARKEFVKVKGLAPDYLDARFNLAQLEIDENQFSQALTEYNDILAAQPLNAEALAGRAKASLLLHDIGDAIEDAEQGLKIDETNVSASLTLAEAKLRNGEAELGRQIALQVVARKDIAPSDRANAFGLAADAADRLGLYDEAFNNYTESNNAFAFLSRHVMSEPPSPYNPLTIRKLMDHLKDVAGDAPPPCADHQVAFLIGFPRSGTTLLEQVLAAHPQVTSHGERTALSDACGDLLLSEDGLNKLGHLNEVQAAYYRTTYWQEIAKLGPLPAKGDIYLDKMPVNTVFLPVIAKVFPTAKILFAVRDPRDVVLSCFQQRFTFNQAMYQLLSLGKAAKYYDQVMALGVKARELFELQICDLRYDDIVDDLEGQARQAIEFLGLEWDPQVLDYRDSIKSRAVVTPSAGQVVEPIYRRSLGKWKNYEAQLAPVLAQLAPWVSHWGYGDEN